MNETTERFLQEIATRVGYDRVAELYLFPVLRQGGVEGAVAVVAAYPETPEGTEAPADSVPAGAEEARAGADGTSGEAAEASSDATADDVTATDVQGEAVSEADGETAREDDAVADAGSVTAAGTREQVAGDAGVEAGDEAGDVESVEAATEPPTEATAEASAESANATRVRARHVVYTARYRHTIKGTDRGRWAVEVVAEADAPLITVEEVVRGVVRRSGDEFQPERLSGEQFRALVPAPAAPGSARA